MPKLKNPRKKKSPLIKKTPGSGTDEILKQIYYDPNHPAAFSSAPVLYQAVKEHGVSLSYVRNWLSQQITHTLHKSRRRKFKRNPTVVSNVDEQWQADIVDVHEFSRQNGGNKYLVTIIDIMSKFAFVFPTKSKSAEEVAQGFVKVFDKRQPVTLQTDQGLEFKNKQLKNVLEERGINYFTTRNTETKCAVVERFNKTLRNKMFKYFTAKGTRRYVDVLESFVSSYNNRVHSSIGMVPSKVTDDDAKTIFKKLYGFESVREMLLANHSKAKPALKTGTQVRIQYDNDPFQKGYYPQWTDEVFTVTKATKDYKKEQFKLKDVKGDEIEGRFYQEEIQPVSEVSYRVEKIIQRRTVRGIKQIKVKWVNYGDEHNSWINKSDLGDVS